MFCGISKADFLEKEARELDQWLKNGNNGNMAYMENHFDKRLDPRLLVDDAKSVVSLMLNYFPEGHQQDPEVPLSRASWGKRPGAMSRKPSDISQLPAGNGK